MRLARSRFGSGIDRGEATLGIELVRPQPQVALVAGHEIPRIGSELVTDGIDEPCWTVDVEHLLAPEHEPE
jgi:hypothetical protein